MTRLICHTCGKCHYLESINDFTVCTCNAALSKDSIELARNVECCVDELNRNITRHAEEGISSKFSIDFI